MLSACQTIDETPRPGTWTSQPPRPPLEQTRSAPFPGAPLFASTRGGPSTLVEGTGQFVGEPPTGALPPATEAGADGVTINLVNVPAPQAAKTILGDILGVKYTVDPGIEGRITIQTPKPVTRMAALDLFQTALRANNAAIVEAGDAYRIVAVDKAAVGAALRVDGQAGLAAPIGSGLTVVPLRYVAAAEIRRVLEPIAPKGGIVRIDDARNLITLAGSRQEIAAMTEAIALFDIDVMQGMSFAIVPVKTSQPDAIATELKAVFASERDGPMAGMIQFLPNRRLGAILVISPQAKYLRRAEAWVRKLDAQAQGSEKQLFTYAVQNRRAQELVEVLQAMFASETGGRAAAGRTVAPNYQEASLQSAGLQSQGGGAGPGLQSALRTASAGGGPGGATGGIGRGAATPAPAAPAGGTIQIGAEAGGEARIKIVADDAKNSVLIEATPDDYHRIQRVITSLDVMPKQVLIEATIAEVTLKDELKFGLRWHIQGGKSSYTFTDALNGAVSSVFPGFSYALTASNVAATLNALNGITDVNVVSSPSLTVMDNRPALLQIGDQVPITTQMAVSTTALGAPIVNSVTYKDTGVILYITPRINASGRVLLDIEQEVSSVVPTTSSGIDSPTIRQRRIKTSVVVNDGDALVLGGLIQDGTTVNRTQIPIIGDIPFLGAAARHKKNEIDKTELIIVITPYVIRNLQEAHGITEEYRQQLSVYGPRKRPWTRKIENTARRILE